MLLWDWLRLCRVGSLFAALQRREWFTFCPFGMVGGHTVCLVVIVMLVWDWLLIKSLLLCWGAADWCLLDGSVRLLFCGVGGLSGELIWAVTHFDDLRAVTLFDQ